MRALPNEPARSALPSYPNHWPAVRVLFERERRLPAPEREALLAAPSHPAQVLAEVRSLLALGPLGGVLVAIVTAETEDHIRIISMRKADKHEQSIYRENLT